MRMMFKLAEPSLEIGIRAHQATSAHEPDALLDTEKKGLVSVVSSNKFSRQHGLSREARL